MTLERDIWRRGGVVLTSQLLQLGHSYYTLKKAVTSGKVLRPRRGWLALPGADRELLFAAAHGVILSCVTQARRLGLWTLKSDEPHCAAPKRGRRIQVPEGVVHWRAPLIVRPPGLLADRIENVLDCVAACQPHDAALAVWDSAMQKRLIDYQALSTLRLRGRARRLLGECSPFADSGLETMFRTRLGWLEISIIAQPWLHGHRVDFLIGERLVVQIDGAHHVGEQRRRDNLHDAVLEQRGYHVIRVGYTQIMFHWEEVHDLITGAIARGLHLAG